MKLSILLSIIFSLSQTISYKSEAQTRIGSYRNLYEILNVPMDADQDTIRKSYHSLARRYHPDRQVYHLDRPVTVADKEAAEEKFKMVTNAYEVLKDPKRRQEYDNLIRARFNQPANVTPSHGQPSSDTNSSPIFSYNWYDIAPKTFFGPVIPDYPIFHSPGATGYLQMLNPYPIGEFLIFFEFESIKRDFNPNGKWKEWPLLNIAVAMGKIQFVDWLLSKGADPNSIGEFGSPLLEIANWFVFHKHRDSAGINIDPFGLQRAETTFKDTSLEIARLLIKHDADITITDKEGNNALHFAAKNGLIRMTALLLYAGIDPTATNNNGETPLDFARRQRLSSVYYSQIESLINEAISKRQYERRSKTFVGRMQNRMSDISKKANRNNKTSRNQRCPY